MTESRPGRGTVGEVAVGPHVTFSADLAFAFVEQTDQTATAEQAVAWLDPRLRDEERLLVPTMTDWSPALARVVSLEVWDEHAGTRVERGAPGARVLWRVEVDDALASDASDGPDADDMEDLSVRLHEHGYLDQNELARSRLLLVAVREQDAERRARQAARPPDAPRALLSEGSGAVIARLFLRFAIAVADAPEDDATGPMRRPSPTCRPSSTPRTSACSTSFAPPSMTSTNCRKSGQRVRSQSPTSSSTRRSPDRD